MKRHDADAMRRVANSVRRIAGGPALNFKPRRKYPVGTIYFIGPEQGLVKIGFTNDLPTRLKRLQCGSPVQLYVLASIADQPTTLEREYHARFRSARQHGEWFLRTVDVDAEIDRLNAPRSFQDVSDGLPCERAGNGGGMWGGLHRRCAGVVL